MAAIKLFKLAPRTAFHFGQRGVGVEGTQVFCHADTLFSALCLTLRELEPDGNVALTYRNALAHGFYDTPTGKFADVVAEHEKVGKLT